MAALRTLASSLPVSILFLLAVITLIVVAAPYVGIALGAVFAKALGYGLGGQYLASLLLGAAALLACFAAFERLLRRWNA